MEGFWDKTTKKQQHHHICCCCCFPSCYCNFCYWHCLVEIGSVRAEVYLFLLLLFSMMMALLFYPRNLPFKHLNMIIFIQFWDFHIWELCTRAQYFTKIFSYIRHHNMIGNPYQTSHHSLHLSFPLYTCQLCFTGDQCWNSAHTCLDNHC